MINSQTNTSVIRKYIGALMKHSETPELRAYWTIVYKYISIQCRS